MERKALCHNTIIPIIIKCFEPKSGKEFDELVRGKHEKQAGKNCSNKS